MSETILAQFDDRVDEIYVKSIHTVLCFGAHCIFDVAKTHQHDRSCKNAQNTKTKQKTVGSKSAVSNIRRFINL